MPVPTNSDPRISSQPNRSGFVLLMVLLAIVVLGASLVTVSQATSQSEINVLRSARALQQRWGILSCQRAVLPAGTGVLARSDEIARQSQGGRQGNRRPTLPSSVRDSLVLGGQSFQLILADEDAKTNLNVLYDLGGKAACERRLGEAVPLSDLRTVRLQPRRESRSVLTAGESRQRASRLGAAAPASEFGPADPEYLDGAPPALTTWGEVFDFPSLVAVTGDTRQIASTTRSVTLWGSGRLNVWRADDDSIIAICREVVQDGLARRIQQRLRDTSLSQVDLVLRQSVTNEKDRRRLAGLLADDSQCASLWIEASDGRIRRRQLTLRMPDETGLIRTIEFLFP